jgi:hypothetical protein
MRNLKLLTAMGVIALAVTAVPARASATFQGLTFTFTQTDANSLTFRIQGTPSGDWTGVNYLASFALKDLGLDFTSATGTANGPGATNLLGLNSQLSASNVDCSDSSGGKNVICFDITPDVALGSLPINFLYTIDFSQNLNIGSLGPHLQIAFSQVQNGPKVGSLYSQNVTLTGTPPTGTPSSSASNLPEPAALSLLGLAFLGVGYRLRRQRI